MSQEVWIVYMVHGFTDYQSGWYPKFRNSIGETYAKNDRKVLMQKVMIDGKEVDLPVIDVKV